MSERCGKTAQCYDDLLKMMQNKDVSTMVLFSKGKEDNILYTQQYVDKLNARIHDLQEELNKCKTTIALYQPYFKGVDMLKEIDRILGDDNE